MEFSHEGTPKWVVPLNTTPEKGSASRNTFKPTRRTRVNLARGYKLCHVAGTLTSLETQENPHCQVCAREKQFGYGSKLNNQEVDRTAGFSPFHLPGYDTILTRDRRFQSFPFARVPFRGNPILNNHSQMGKGPPTDQGPTPVWGFPCPAQPRLPPLATEAPARSSQEAGGAHWHTSAQRHSKGRTAESVAHSAKPGVPSNSILSRDPNLSRNRRKPREYGSGFWKERWLKRMGNQPLEARHSWRNNRNPIYFSSLFPKTLMVLHH